VSKKEKIAEVSLRLFVGNGFHGTPTSKIAQEAGVANGTLFNYFKTKDELVIALYISVKDEMAEYLAQHTTTGRGLKEVMKSQFLASLFWALDNELKFRFIQLFHTSPYIEKMAQEVLQNQAGPHLGLIQQGIDERVFKPLPADLIFTLISSQTFGLYQYLASRSLSKVEQHEVIQQTFELLWDMLI
jgi:AcrR family transcriptional regulator